MSLPEVNTGYRLMGFGHRVYKTYDPRAKIMKKVCDQVLEHVGIRSMLTPPPFAAHQNTFFS